MQERSTQMNTKQPQIESYTDSLRMSCVIGAIVASALAFSMNVTSFLHVKETALAILLIPLALMSINQRDRNPKAIQQFLPLILLTLIPFALSLLPNYSQVPALMHREQARLAVLILYALLAFNLLRDERHRHIITNAFLATATIAALLAYLQKFDLATWLFPVFEDSNDPLYSVFGNSGLLAGYLAMAVPVGVHRALTTTRSAIPLLMLATITPILVFTSSRGSWIAAVIGTLVILPYRDLPKKRIFVTTVILAISTATTFINFQETRPGQLLSQEKQDTIRLRLWFWDGALRMTAANPITGVGPGNFQYWSPHYQGDALHSNPSHTNNEAHTLYAHNEPLHLAAETGLIGFLLCGWIVFRLMRCKGPEWGGLAAALTFSLFHFPLRSAPHALMAILLAAMLLARRTESEDRSPSDAAPRTKADPTHSQDPSLRGESPPNCLANQDPSLRGVSPPNCLANREANDAAISPNGITQALIQKPWILLAAIASILLAAFTIYDILRPSIALNHANTLYNENQPANEAYKKATNTGHYHPKAHADYANLLLEQGLLIQAREQLELALKGQDTGDLHLALGYIHLQQGNTQLAKRHLQNAIHRWPKNEAARQYLQQANH